MLRALNLSGRTLVHGDADCAGRILDVTATEASMGRRYAFELFYAADRVSAALEALRRILPTGHRKQELAARLNRLTPESPLFLEVTLLFPVDDVLQAYYPLGDVHSEWTDDGVECLPFGVFDLAVRAGVRYALLSITARTSRMSDLLKNSPAVWSQFAALLRSSGGLVGMFQGVDHVGAARYPLLPDGREAVELDFFDFVLEERDTYWQIDTDRYAAAVLQAPRAAV
jgi:hypothetical protein